MRTLTAAPQRISPARIRFAGQNFTTHASVYLPLNEAFFTRDGHRGAPFIVFRGSPFGADFRAFSLCMPRQIWTLTKGYFY